MNYFEGFEFKSIPNVTKRSPLTSRPRKNVPAADYKSREKITIADLWEMENLDGLTVTDEPFIPWTPDSIRHVFAANLEGLSRVTRELLSMERRRMRFVRKGEMKPKTQEERDSIVERYGKLINIGGDCRRNSDGTFSIRIARAGMGNVISMNEVQPLMAHEFGHTLGDEIDDLFEEVKAFAFGNLFMRQYYGIPFRDHSLHQSTHHQRAVDYVYQLLEAGISEEAILAHLIGQPFGGANPNDYQRSL